mgnify:CR=1 FL=1
MKPPIKYLAVAFISSFPVDRLVNWYVFYRSIHLCVGCIPVFQRTLAPGSAMRSRFGGVVIRVVQYRSAVVQLFPAQIDA